MDDENILNPLLNELILSNIFSHLPLKNLQDFRHVCKIWAQNSELKQRIDEEITIDLCSYETLEYFQTFLETWNPSLSPNSSFPFKRFNLQFTAQCHTLCDSDHILTPEQEQAAQLGKGKLKLLFDKMNELPIQTRYLKLTLDKTHLDKPGLEKLLLCNNSVINNLDTLYLYNLSHRAVFSRGFQFQTNYQPRHLRRLVMDEIRISITEFCTHFFKIFSNIEEIVLKCDKRSDWANQNGIWKEHSPLASSIIQGLHNSPEASRKLRSFRCGILDMSHFLLLLDLGHRKFLKLFLLEIYCPAKDVTSAIIQEFLKTQSQSLRVLRVLGNVQKLRRAVGNNSQNPNNEESPPEFILQLPEKMEKLEEFQLSGRDKDTPIPVQAINYGKQCPCLKTLIVNGFASNISGRMEDYFPQRFLRRDSFCLSLRRLVLPAKIRDPLFLLNASQLFPNVVDLEIKYPDAFFLQAVFRNFAKLKRLRILAETNLSLEEGFLGNDGIENLTDLEITVETEHTEVPTALTDNFGNVALRRMKNLRKLVLISCCWFDGPITCNFLTKRCQESLMKELDNCVIIFQPLEPATCPLPEVIGQSYEMMEFFGS